MHDSPKPVQGSIGVTFIVAFKNPDGTIRDISAADSLEIHIKPPDGSLVILPAQLYTDGTDGLASHLDQAGVLGEFGCFQIWGLERRGIAVIPTEVGTFDVESAPPLPLPTSLSPAPVVTVTTVVAPIIT